MAKKVKAKSATRKSKSATKKSKVKATSKKRTKAAVSKTKKGIKKNAKKPRRSGRGGIVAPASTLPTEEGAKKAKIRGKKAFEHGRQVRDPNN